VYSDHNPVVITVKIKLKKIFKAEGSQRWDMEKLKDFITAIEYKCDSDRALESQEEHETSVHGR